MAPPVSSLAAYSRCHASDLAAAITLAEEMLPSPSGNSATEQVFLRRAQDLLALILWLASRSAADPSEFQQSVWRLATDISGEQLTSLLADEEWFSGVSDHQDSRAARALWETASAGTVKRTRETVFFVVNRALRSF